MSLVNPQLEAAILAAPNDASRYAVYGDWLLANGDPRGELVAIQAALATQTDPSKFLELKKSEASLLARVEPTALPLSPAARERVTATWRWGFVNQVRVEPRGEDPATLLAEVLRLPALRFVQGVAVCALGDDGPPPTSLAPVCEVLSAMRPPLLRRVELRGPVAGVSALERAFPTLEHLALEGGRADSLAFPELRTLELRRLEPTDGLRAVVAAARWPKLKTLTVELDFEEPVLRPLLMLPGLTGLTLGGEDCGPLIAAVASRTDLSRLAELDLISPTYDELLTPLLARRASLSKLKLDIHLGELEGKLVKQLRSSVKALVLGAVRVWEDEDPGMITMDPEESARWRERERELKERATRESDYD